MQSCCLCQTCSEDGVERQTNNRDNPVSLVYSIHYPSTLIGIRAAVIPATDIVQRFVSHMFVFLFLTPFLPSFGKPTVLRCQVYVLKAWIKE